MQKALLIILPLLLLIFAAGSVQAVTVDSVGNATTNGTISGTWYYTRENPTLMGTAAPNDSVGITIDNSSESVNADAQGSWSYAPTTLTTGTHTVTVSDSTSTQTFTLEIGSAGPSTASMSATPVAGNFTPTLAFMAAGLALISFGVYTQKQT